MREAGRNMWLRVKTKNKRKKIFPRKTRGISEYKKNGGYKSHRF